MISFARVGKTFKTRRGGHVQALDDVTIEVKPGEFVAIVGASGCGKSTLLRMVAGLVKPDIGHLTLDGKIVTEATEGTAMVFQSPTLLPWMNVERNVGFPLSLAGRDNAEARERGRRLLQAAGLKGFEQRMPRELSGGMQQRVAICRGLVQNPRILLMDEPFGALDALTREEMSLSLLALWQANPMAVLFVTHSIAEAVLLADRVIVMSPRPGRVAEIVEVDLPRPRSFDQEASAEFHRCSKLIRDRIYGRGAHAQ